MNKPQLTYINNEGLEVKTSQFLRNRGSCCKTNCLHCPYGFTLKNHPIKTRQLVYEDIATAQSIVDENQEVQSESSVASSLMGSAFGGNKKSKLVTIDAVNFDSFAFIELKGVICGVIEISTVQAKQLFLKEQFKDQGIDLDIVNSSI